MASKPQGPLLGTVLVVGGCGFLGYHLVGHLLQDEECESVCVLDRNIDANRHAEASYVLGNITDKAAISSLVSKIRPRVIFHAASPLAYLPQSRQHEFTDTNIVGTECLLSIAAASDAVAALVYTSTVDSYSDPPHDCATESHPLWAPTARTTEYNRTKAIADRLVRAANSPQLRTVCLRPGHMYGERHVQGMVEVLDMCEGGRALFQVGNGANLMEVASADNTAAAHVLAAKALVDPSRARGKVDGEAFNVSDGAPVPFWHHIGVIWKVARGEDALKGVTVIPAWVMIVLSFLVEWSFWIFTLDMIKPPTALRRTAVEYCIYSHTYSIQKARERLLFEPVVDHDAVLAQSARWMLERRQRTKTRPSKED